MDYRKTGFGFFVWGVSEMLLGMLLTLTLTHMAANLGIIEEKAVLPFVITSVILLCLFSFLLYAAAGRFLLRNQPARQDFFALEMILAAAVFLFLIAFGVKKILLSLTPDGNLYMGDGQYFRMAAVTADNQPIPWMAHGASYVFTVMLRGMCQLFGNLMMSLLLLQVLLLLAAAAFLYFAMRGLFGKMAAFAVAAGVTFLPAFGNAAIDATAELLLFCVMALAWLLLALLLRAVSRGKMKNPAWGILFLGYGTFLSGCMYLDVLGVLFLPVSLAGLFLVRRTKEGTDGKKPCMQNRILQAFLICLGVLLGAFGLCFGRAYAMGTALDAPLWEYLALYSGSWQGYAGLWEIIVSRAVFSNAAILVLAASGIFGFWITKQDKFCMAGLFFTGACLLRLIQHDGISYQAIEHFAILLLAALSLQTAADYRKEQYAKKAAAVEKLKTETAQRQEEMQEMQEIQEIQENQENQEIQEIQEIQETPKVRLLENPLPLPKKHVPKTMDYPMETAMEGYDIAVQDDDDFDI